MQYELRVSELPPNYKEEDLLRLCASFGDVVDFRKNFSNEEGESISAKENNSKYYSSSIFYAEKLDAEMAAANMNGMIFENQILRAIALREEVGSSWH